MPSFDDFQRRVQHQPKYQVRDLADPASNTGARFSGDQFHTKNKAPVSVWSADESPERKGFAWADQNTVQGLHNQPNVLSLVALEFRIRVPKAAK
ncbi:MAG: hypothetical protein AAF219_04385 [Myxococcota bacterium]